VSALYLRSILRHCTIGRIACALAVALVAGAADADVVELMSGERLEGKIALITDELVYVETGAGVLLIPRHTIRSMSGTAPVGPATGSAGDVLKALKGLQAAAASSTSQQEYKGRVDQSREIVVKFLQEGSSARLLAEPVRDAFALYELAAAAWESRLTNSATASAAIGRSAVIDRCPALQKIVADYPPATDQETAWRRGTAIEFEVPTILRCASDKVTEAERAMGR
jgi:hypothetical protein